MGDKTHLVMTQEIQSKATIKDKPINNTTTTSMDMTWTITAVDDKDVASMTQAIDRMQIKVQGPQGVILDYDSQTGKKPEGPAAILAPFLEALTGREFKAKMDSRGRILEMKLPKETLDSLNKIAGGSMGNTFSEEGLKEMGQIGLLPEKAVRPGDTWTREAGAKKLGMAVEATYRYLGTEKRDGKELDKVGTEMKIQFNTDKEGTVKIKSQQDKGVMYFDNKAGQCVGGNDKMKMILETSLNGQTFDSELEMTQDWKVKPEGTPKK